MANMNICMALVKMKCRSSFMAKEKCCCSFITKTSIDEASWQRRMFLRLYGKDNWCGYVAKTSVEHLHAKISASIVLLQGLMQVLLHCQHKSQHDFMVRMVDVVMLQRQVLKQLNCQDKSQYSFKDKCQG